MRRSVLALLLAAAAASAGCNQESPSDPSGAGASAKTVPALLEETNAAMDAKDWKKALATSTAAIGDARATPEEKAEAWADRLICEAHVNGGAAASSAVEAMDQAGVKLSVAQYRDVGFELANASAPEAALAVLDVAKRVHGADPAVKAGLKNLAKYVQQKLTEGGDTAGLEKLNSLGYLGGGGDDEEEDEDPIKKSDGGGD